MKLYRYRSLQRFEFVADILCNDRFHASQYFDLNDPMEGLFDYDPDTKREYLERIIEGKSKLRIVSFSKNPKDLLLWAHYADGFRGVCIEVEVGRHSSFDSEAVIYSPFRNHFTNDEQQSIAQWSRYILRAKNEAWNYEEEVRIFSTEKFIEHGIRVSSVLLGVRTPEVMVEAIKRLSKGRFPIYRTRISDLTNSVESIGHARSKNRDGGDGDGVAS